MDATVERALWGPEWLPLPWGGAIHRDDMAPCPCDEEVFNKFVRPGGGTLFVGCRRCIRPKNGDVCVGSVNMRTGEVRDYRKGDAA